MPAYDTDLSDEQWLLIAPLIPRPKGGGRRRTTSERRVVDGILYLLKTGCQWRQLPNEFPPWRTVYGYFADWGAVGVWKKLHRKLYFESRELAGRAKYPSVAVIDSQSVRTGKMGEGENQLPKVVQGIKFQNGIEVIEMPAHHAA
jgi:putative transposase